MMPLSTVVGKDNDHIRFRQTGENNNNKFMMVDFKDGTKKLKIKNYTLIDDLCTNNSLDFKLSKDEITGRADDCTNST
jgi:hypothetical protein